MGSAAGRTLHVGLGADRSWLPEALFLLLRVADRRAGAEAAKRRRRRAGGCRASAPRLPVHRARGRQLLSGDARRSGAGAPPLRPVAAP